jgi:sugar/nucleoside kinase (ribokinase family)
MNLQALFVGITTLDIQYLVKDYPKSNIKTRAHNFKMSTGGPATNAAVTFSFLGGTSHLWSVIGNHVFTQFFLNDLEKWNIRVKDLSPEITELPSVSSIITSGSTGDRSIIYSKVRSNIFPEDYLVDVNKETFDILLVDALNMKASIEVAKYAKGKNIPVVLDGGSWKTNMEQLLPNITVALCSEDFYPPGISKNELVLNFLKESGIPFGAISRGQQSILYYDKSGTGEIRVLSTSVIDTLGAGDILHGAFCYFFLKYRNFRKALEKAAEIASRSCEYFGTRDWMN